MQTLKERKPLLVKILGILLLIILCCILPEEILFWQACKEQDRNIPPNTEILVSACVRPHVVGVPGGEVVFVREGRTNNMYLLDLRTGEKRDVPNDPLLLDHGIFLSPELVWLEGSLIGPEDTGYRPHYILDLTDGKRYELLDLKWLPRLEGGEFDSKYFSYFLSAKQVFIHHSQNILIALPPDFRQQSDKIVIFSQSSLGSIYGEYKNGELLEQLLQDLGKDFEIVDFSVNYANVPSPTGRYIVRGDGIYLSGTDTLIINRNMKWYFAGWYYDESGVVYQEGGGYMFEFIESQGHFLIPTPILKLLLPVP